MVYGWDSEPPTERIDLDKLRAGLERMRVAIQRGAPLSFPPEYRAVEWALVEFGCFGTWPDVEPLARSMQALGSYWHCSADEAFARLDSALDWVLEQPRPSPLWEI